MFKFNDTNILTGYIKEMLASFNLPCYKVYTRQQREHFEETGEELNVIASQEDQEDDNPCFVSYIKDGSVQQYVKNKEGNSYTWKVIADPYLYNIFVPNETKNYVIKNNIYDYYTHEYLGEYLRFIRDFHNVDLMPLYNCFSDHICNNIELTFDVGTESTENSGTTGEATSGAPTTPSEAAEGTAKADTTTTTPTKKTTIKKSLTFSGSDAEYKIYMLPVKLFQKYTIAIDCQQEYELCCGIYGKYLDTREIFKSIPEKTYKKVIGQFSKPILYDLAELLPNKLPSKELTGTPEEQKNKKEQWEETMMWLAKNEGDLKLFIKLPASNNSSITVLEGDYRSWNDSYGVGINKTQNKTVLNFDASDECLLNSDLKLITPLQLLKFNTGKSYPFADRLVEYLLGNAITPLDEIADNIKRVQTIALKNGQINKADGIWTDKLQKILYNFMNSEELIQGNKKETNHDILGYADKDVENAYYAKMTNNVETLLQVDLYKNELNTIVEEAR